MEDNKKNVKKGILIGCITSAAILLGFLGSYAYFIGASNNNKQESTKVETGNMALTFTDGSSSFQGSLEFGGSATKTFSIENTGSLEAKAKINWKNLKNTYLKESLTYTLSYSEIENGTYTEIITNRKVPRSESPVTKTLASNMNIPVGKTYYYKLVITLNYLEDIDQTADLNAMLSTEFSLEESNSEPLLDLILSKTNESNIKTYDLGNKSEMFTFLQPETEQTTRWNEDERTDYRYIGNVPNNYIEFNDETWRILGVFTVENEDSEKEQRVKIIRDESIGDIAWDTNNINEWPTSSLSTLLNKGDYYNRSGDYASKGLTATAKSQIAPVKWYLGGTNTSSFSASGLYSLERGTAVYTGNSINTVANVGLMYPSDYVYTYAFGIDDTCFTSGNLCSSSQNMSWLVNPYIQWTITSLSTHSNHTLKINNLGTIASGAYTCCYKINYPYDTRPTVYLNPDIEIISGNGSLSNPYKLKEQES